MNSNIKISKGRPYPLGSTLEKNGVNFSLYSKDSQKVRLLLFDLEDQSKPSEVFELVPEKNKTFHYWHIKIKGLKAGQLYGWQCDGSYLPKKGLFFDGEKVLLDPYTKAVYMDDNYKREDAIHKGANYKSSMKSVVIDSTKYNWRGDEPLSLALSETIIYEMHLKGFTRDASAFNKSPGTYKGLIEKIPYLKKLGITAVELLPVQHFDANDVVKTNPINGEKLSNYWGYQPIGFFAPHSLYASSKEPGSEVNEFRDMVRAFHKNGIEVILDVVFNHTAEGGTDGPLLSFRGIANTDYYITDEKNPANYKDYSGCGNTFNSNNPICRNLIMDSLRYWVQEMHVDGFRFDLASVLSRDMDGKPIDNPPLLWSIDSCPVLAGTKIIAEAWDAGGLYQVGSFIGDKWCEWNGLYRDSIRKFVKGDKGSVEGATLALMGNPDLYQKKNRDPHRSVNFVTCHDGFTMRDLVSYSNKHNKSNGEDSRDGSNDNHSWNHGIEGSTNDKKTTKLRLRQVKNIFTLLFLSQGTPMILAGDEFFRTQMGNNNIYCQDNPLGWINWTELQHNKSLFDFVRKLIQFKKEEKILNHSEYLTSKNLTWHGTRPGKPDHGFHSHSLSYTLNPLKENENIIHVIANSYWENLNFILPSLPTGFTWFLKIDTYKASPNDITVSERVKAFEFSVLNVAPRSVVVLIGKQNK